MKAFPSYRILIKKLADIRSKIAQARGSAGKRDGIYQDIENTDFPALIALYNEFSDCEPMMREMAGRQRRDQVIAYVVGAIGILVGVVDFIYHMLK